MDWSKLNPWAKKPLQVVLSAPTNLVRSMWRTNMWVVTPMGIGIIVSIETQCLVHLVNEDGTTKEQVSLPLAALRQAYYKEIPEVRRGDIEAARKLGYF
jgi:hypothetical protein